MAVNEGITAGGDFELEVAEILTSNGVPIELHPSNVMSITLYEDIQMGAVTGTIVLHNSAAFSNIGPIIGQEFLKLKIKTSSITASEDIMDFTENVFHIYRVGTRIHSGEKTEALTLFFTTSESMKNFRTRVSRTLEGTYSDIVQKVMTDHLDCKKTLYIEPSAGVKKIVSPNLRRFDIIRMATREAISSEDSSPTFLFYETLDGGYHFRSLDSLYAQDSVWSYTTTSPGKKVGKGGQLKVLDELKSLLTYNVNHNNIMSDTVMGALGSKLIVHDIFNKTYSEHTYNYLNNYENERHIDDGYPLYSKSPLDQKQNKVSDFTGRVFLEPTSIKDVKKSTDGSQLTDSGRYEFTSKNPDKWLQRRISQIEGIKNGISINTSVHGNTIVSAGDIVTIDIPYHAEVKTNERNKSDKFLKGKFLLARVRHDFNMGNKKHSMGLTCVRDSSPEELEFDDSVYEPKPMGNADIINDFYTSNLGAIT